MIQEIGIFRSGIPLVNCRYNSLFCKTISESIVFHGTLYAFVSMTQEFFSQNLQEIRAKDIHIIFQYEQNLVAYAIIKTPNGIENGVFNELVRTLHTMLMTFLKTYGGSNLEEHSKFKSFKREINRVFTEIEV